MEIIIGLLASLVWGIFSGLTLLLANWFANFMWLLSSKNLFSKIRAIFLYIGLQVGGLLIVGTYFLIFLAILDSNYPSISIADSLAMIFASIIFIFFSFKKKWFRPAVTTLNDFLHTKPPTIQ